MCVIAFQYPYILSLLSNSTLEIHNYLTQKLVQRIDIPPSSARGDFLTQALFSYDLHHAQLSSPSEMSVILSGPASVLGLVMVSLDVQVCFLSHHLLTFIFTLFVVFSSWLF
jgi:hypothetical protein